MPTASKAPSPTAELLARCYNDPALFHTRVLGQPPFYPQQMKMIDCVMSNDISVIVTGNQLGKTVLGASLALWHTYTRQNAVTITTASTYKQLTKGLWEKIRIFKDNAVIPLTGKVTGGSTQLLTVAPGWYTIGTTTTEADKISGLRSGLGNTIAIVDEASGVSDKVWEGLMSIGCKKIVLIGNPLKDYGFFRDTFIKGQLPEHAGRIGSVQIPSYESPHINLWHSPYGLASQSWLANSEALWGKDSLWWVTHVDARFPTAGEMSLFKSEWLDAAVCQSYPRDVKNGPTRMGIDVAEGTGNDSSFIGVTDDNGILELVGSNRWKHEETARKARELQLKYGVEPFRIAYDQGGGGADFNNRLLAVGINGAIGYKGKHRSGDKQYANLRTLCAHRFRNRLRPDRVGIDGNPQPRYHIPEEIMRKLRRQLLAVSVENVDENQVALESKEVMSAKIGGSPDALDAIIVSFAVRD